MALGATSMGHYPKKFTAIGKAVSKRGLKWSLVIFLLLIRYLSVFSMGPLISFPRRGVSQQVEGTLPHHFVYIFMGHSQIHPLEAA